MFYLIKFIIITLIIHMMIWVVHKMLKYRWETAAIVVMIGLIVGLILKVY